MNFDLTDNERQYLLHILNTASREMMVEINRSDAIDYREQLRQQLRLIDGLRAKIERDPGPAETTMSGGL